MNLKSYSLTDSKGIPIDVKLDNLFNGKTNGVYIELGAFDGITQSNTAYFEFYKEWSGLLIEPSKDSYEMCCKNRPNSICVNLCCVSFDYNSNKIKGDFNSKTMSSVNGERLNSTNLIEVNCDTLNNIINSNIPNTPIDLLSLDAEGYEFNILKGLNLNEHRPKFILIEVYENDFNLIFKYLSENNYKLHSNFSKYNKNNNPIWDGTHNDYLFFDNLHL